MFTFIVTKSVTRDFHRDVTTKDFTYNHQKWAISFGRVEKYLGAYLVWRNPCVGMKCYVDFVFTIVNREHFSLNEVFSAKQCRFNVDQTVNGNRKLIPIGELPARNFTDENGEFQLEVSLSNVRSVFESDIRALPQVTQGQGHASSGHVPPSPSKGQKLETNCFIFGNCEWNVALYPQVGDLSSGGGTGSRDGTRLLVCLNRLTGFDHQCRVRYRVVLGEGDRRVDSGIVDDFSDSDGRCYGWTMKGTVGDLVRRGLIRVHVEMLVANMVSEVRVHSAASTATVPGSGASGSIGASGPPGVSAVPLAHAHALCYDRDKQSWSVEADGNTEFLRLKLIYKDILNVPRNHLRYVGWSAHVLRRHPKTGAREPVTVLNAPLGKYYAQDESDEGVLMETGIPMREIHDPCCRYSEGNNQIIVQIEWIESLLLFQATYHKYDDISRTQNYQMKREISALQAENYSLERQLFSYQKSLAYASSRGHYSDDLSTPDGYGHNHMHHPAYDERSLSETD